LVFGNVFVEGFEGLLVFRIDVEDDCGELVFVDRLEVFEDTAELVFRETVQVMEMGEVQGLDVLGLHGVQEVFDEKGTVFSAMCLRHKKGGGPQLSEDADLSPVISGLAGAAEEPTVVMVTAGHRGQGCEARGVGGQGYGVGIIDR